MHKYTRRIAHQSRFWRVYLFHFVQRLLKMRNYDIIKTKNIPNLSCVTWKFLFARRLGQKCENPAAAKIHGQQNANSTQKYRVFAKIGG